jgi:site-specific recombinase XerD
MKHKEFISDLQNRGLQASTINDHLRTLEKFQVYLQKRKIHTQSVSHKIAVQYAQYLKTNQRYIARTVNNKMGQLKSYYAYLNRVNNPFGSVKIRGVKYRLQVGLLSNEELLALFQSLPQTTTLEQRVKILSSFYIFQGITTTELLQLSTSAFNWDDGSVTLPKTTLSNERTLTLHPSQLRFLLKFVESKDYPNVKPLYMYLGNGQQDKWVIKHLHLSLKVKPHYRSLRHIRYSIIINWLKTDNLRVVQYKAGHRYISSTEKYLQNDISTLKDAVNVYHPLG